MGHLALLNANSRGSGSARLLGPTAVTMNTSTETATRKQSDAEKRVITIETEAGDIVKFSGNPAELPGCRHETRKAMMRSGAFRLLISNNASRLPNGQICVDDINNIPFVTELIPNPYC